MTSKLLNKFPIPENFPDILHDFAKEVVREQPKDILDFAVEYFKALETGTPLDYGHKHEKLNSCDTNELATNPATKTNFDIKREDKPKEEIDNNSIEEKEGQQSNQSGSSSSNKSEESHNESVSQKNDNEEQKEKEPETHVKDFISDIFKESMNAVSRSQNSLLYSNIKPIEPAVVDNNQLIKSDEQQAKDFIEDVLRSSQEEVKHIIQNLKPEEDKED